MDNMLRHKRDAHKIKESKEGAKYYCDNCSKHFSRRDTLKYHKKVTHEKTVHFNCEECDKNFTTKQSLTNHRKQTHEGIRYNCDHCERQFSQKIHLKYHVKNQHKSSENYPGIKTVCHSERKISDKNGAIKGDPDKNEVDKGKDFVENPTIKEEFEFEFEEKIKTERLLI